MLRMLHIAATLLVCAADDARASAATVKVEIADQALATTSDHYTCASAHHHLRLAE